ncbi:MAG: helix-turn-helix domain-containing protein [Pyrinomonadaceae bacterium]
MNSFITTKEASEKLRVSVRRVQALIAAGRLPAEKIGNSYAIRETDLRLVKGRRNGRPSNGEKFKEEKDWSAIIKRFAGSLKGGPPDLSTNRKYMEGFGRDKTSNW